MLVSNKEIPTITQFDNHPTLFRVNVGDWVVMTSSSRPAVMCRVVNVNEENNTLGVETPFGVQGFYMRGGDALRDMSDHHHYCWERIGPIGKGLYEEIKNARVQDELVDKLYAATKAAQSKLVAYRAHSRAAMRMNPNKVNQLLALLDEAMEAMG